MLTYTILDAKTQLKAGRNSQLVIKLDKTFVRLCAKCFAWLVLRRSCVAGDTGEEKRQPVNTKTLQRKMSEVIDKPGRKEYNTHCC